MNGKVVIVTGANAGIGKETARALSKKGASVIMACRNLKLAEEARKEIVADTKNNLTVVMELDLSSIASMQNFTKSFLNKYDRLDVLVNNAGAFFSTYGETEDGFERQFGINHLGPFYLTHGLIPLLIKSAPSRIVNVSSAGHYKGKMHWENLNIGPEHYNGRSAYRQSKLANVLFTKSLARKLRSLGVTANCLHPGVVKTDIGSKSKDGIEQYIWKLIKPFMISQEKGAETSIHLATDQEVAQVSGEYFDKCKIKESSKRSYNEESAERLWQVSLKLLNLSDIEPPL